MCANPVLVWGRKKKEETNLFQSVSQKRRGSCSWCCLLWKSPILLAVLDDTQLLLITSIRITYIISQKGIQGYGNLSFSQKLGQQCLNKEKLLCIIHKKKFSGQLHVWTDKPDWITKFTTHIIQFKILNFSSDPIPWSDLNIILFLI